MLYPKITITIIMFLLMTVLTGCSLMHPAAVTDPAKYSLSYSPSQAIPNKQARFSLLVYPTQVSPSLQSNHMLYMKKTYRMDSFSKNEWVAPPAKMFTSLIAKALQDSGHFHAVIVAPFTGNIDLRLYTYLYQLRQEFLQKPSVVRVSLAAQLVNAHTGTVIATQQFLAVEPAPSESPYGGVIAANRAVNKLLTQLAGFCIVNSNSNAKTT